MSLGHEGVVSFVEDIKKTCVVCRFNGVSRVDFKIVVCRCVEFKNSLGPCVEFRDPGPYIRP